MAEVIGDAETKTVPDTQVETYFGLQVSGELQVSGQVYVTDSTQDIIGKSRAEGEKDLIARADGIVD